MKQKLRIPAIVIATVLLLLLAVHLSKSWAAPKPWQCLS